MKCIQILPLLFLILDGCIEPLALNSVASEKKLVVDGLITDQTGPYLVKLFWSSSLAGDQVAPDMVRGAAVSIIDSEGSSFALSESEPGVYATGAGLQGEVGKTYTLQISTEDGTQYRSSEETMVPAGEIDSLYARYHESSINLTDASLPQDAISFYLNARPDADNPKGLMRWRSMGIYEILTFPELRTKMEDNIRVPNPLPCSGYVRDGLDIVKVDICTCCSCWVYEYSSDAVVSAALYHHPAEMRDIAIVQVPVDRWRFSHKYFLEVEQLSISERVYEFWNRVGAQQRGTGSLFQPNAIKIKGNLTCVSDSRQEVFGVFAVSSIAKKSMFFTRGQLPKLIGQPDPVTSDCRFIFKNSDNVRPPFW